LNVVGTAAIGSSTNVATGTYAIALGEGCGAAAAVSIAIGVEDQRRARSCDRQERACRQSRGDIDRIRNGFVRILFHGSRKSH
jgi:hypothetical protein